MADEQKVMAGDAIEVTVAFRHSANVEGVEARFVKEPAENPEGHRGRPVDFYETVDNPDVYRRDPGALVTEHTARLRADITAEHEPGPYRCAAFSVVTAGGKRHPFSRFPHFGFEVVPEPEEQPALQGDFRPLDR